MVLQTMEDALHNGEGYVFLFNENFQEMKAQELRIGNFVGLNLDNDPQNLFFVKEVASVSMKLRECGMLLRDIGDVQYYDEEVIEPIPVSNEWLLRFGFEKSVDSYGGYLIEIGSGEKIRIKNDGGWCWPMNGRHYPKVRFVHQLQNLYFALTGIELEIKNT